VQKQLYNTFEEYYLPYLLYRLDIVGINRLGMSGLKDAKLDFPLPNMSYKIIDSPFR